ncbi:MAG: hypothetical protein H0X12_07090 [Nocardioides sp.]|nr:hypothetical protein [Nocardioides sp.]
MVTALLDAAERVWPVLLFLVLIQVVAEISLVRFGLEGLLVVPFALAAGVLAAYATG